MELEQGRVFPVAGWMREVARAVVIAVAAVAHQQEHATRPLPDDLAAELQRTMYVPHYT